MKTKALIYFLEWSNQHDPYHDNEEEIKSAFDFLNQVLQSKK